MGKDRQIRSITEKDRNINWFRKGDQRKLVMMQFYAELESMGINYDIGIKNNLHVDDFEFIFYKRFDIELPVKVYRIMSRFEKTINQTCTSCGKTSYRSGSSYFCARCIFKSEKARRYEKISDFGFAAISDRNSNKSRRQFFYWNEFLGAEFIYEEDLRFRHFPNQVKLCFKPGIVETDEVDWLYITDWYENYFNVLKHIPDYLLNEDSRLNKTDLIENLNYCVICGYKAVYGHKGCLVCKCLPTIALNDRQKKRYSSIEEFNKLQQLEYYKECKYRYKYPRHESAFEKSDTHKMLITKDELKNYRYRK